MKLHYFYAPSEHRAAYKAKGFIAFKLKAFYTEQAYSQKKRREITRFNYLDEVTSIVNTKAAGQYDFKFDHGKDGCVVRGEGSYKELCEALAFDGYKPVKEADYFRLRKLATALLFRHTNFNQIWWGRNEYYYSNVPGNFYALQLASFHYHHNLKRDAHKFQVWKLNSLAPLYNVITTETIKLFIHKDEPGEAPYETYKFEISAANPHFGFVGIHQSFQRAVKATFFDHDQQKITLHQYERLRKIAKHLIWEHADLNVKPLKKRQDYSITILDL